MPSPSMYALTGTHTSRKPKSKRLFASSYLRESSVRARTLFRLWCCWCEKSTIVGAYALITEPSIKKLSKTNFRSRSLMSFWTNFMALPSSPSLIFAQATTKYGCNRRTFRKRHFERMTAIMNFWSCHSV
jgi:hypothetical protein